jgi:hypothetical protein
VRESDGGLKTESAGEVFEALDNNGFDAAAQWHVRRANLQCPTTLCMVHEAPTLSTVEILHKGAKERSS